MLDVAILRVPKIVQDSSILILVPGGARARHIAVSSRLGRNHHVCALAPITSVAVSPGYQHRHHGFVRVKSIDRSRAPTKIDCFTSLKLIEVGGDHKFIQPRFIQSELWFCGSGGGTKVPTSCPPSSNRLLVGSPGLLPRVERLTKQESLCMLSTNRWI